MVQRAWRRARRQKIPQCRRTVTQVVPEVSQHGVQLVTQLMLSLSVQSESFETQFIDSLSVQHGSQAETEFQLEQQRARQKCFLKRRQRGTRTHL